MEATITFPKKVRLNKCLQTASKRLVTLQTSEMFLCCMRYEMVFEST